MENDQIPDSSITASSVVSTTEAKHQGVESGTEKWKDSCDIRAVARLQNKTRHVSSAKGIPPPPENFEI